jgi:peroxiredoxin Q/BCP
MAEPLEVGKAVPAVETKNQKGEAINLKEAAAKGWVLVYFYPKADTPGCTKQACSLRDADTDLKKAGVTVFGVSRDTVDDQKAFADKFTLPFDLLADVDGKVCEAFGVPVRGEKFASRQAYLFKDGKLVWRDLEASTAEQAADVMKAIGEVEK